MCPPRPALPPHPAPLPADQALPAKTPAPTPTDSSPWNTGTCQTLANELHALRQDMLAHEAAHADALAQVAPPQQASARNLLHYLCLRQHDRRNLQESLASLGLSSLGRAESHVLANLDKVQGLLHSLMGQPWADLSSGEPAGLHTSQHLLERHTQALLGKAPPERQVRIMVTLPPEAATQAVLVQSLVAAGMDIARINCAHDGPQEWKAMVGHVRRAEKTLGRPVRVLMDLGGPKLRTGQLPDGPEVLKIRPRRDVTGRVLAPATLGLYPHRAQARMPGASVHVGVKADWLAELRVGDRIDLVDARDAHRTLTVVATGDTGARVEAEQTVYLVPQTRLTRQRHARHAPANTRLSGVPATEGRLLLQRGDHFRVVAQPTADLATTTDAPSNAVSDAAHDATPDTVQAAPLPTVPCTLPEVFSQVQAGERIWFDDGRIGGVVKTVSPDGWVVEITQARDGGERLASDKGINLPDSLLDLPALTPKDVDDLAVTARLADMVGLSFVQRAQDVEELRNRLAALGAGHLGIVLKIETRRAFENLPALMLSAMASPASGLMIARGDLAVECGHERLAEIQEELLWAAEAAHMPVIWATQVLETLAKTGLPSRAEITDAAMGERAECVMLNKGPHILQAMHTLDGILRRMQGHQSKKRSLLRALGSWTTSLQNK